MNELTGWPADEGVGRFRDSVNVGVKGQTDEHTDGLTVGKFHR